MTPAPGDDSVAHGSGFRKSGGFFLRLLASVGMVWFVVRKLDWASVGVILGQADWRLLGSASALTILPILLLSLRWHLFIRQQGILISGRDVFFLTWAGQFFNTVLPGNTGGDFVKIFQLCRIAPGRKAGAVASVVVDRLTALAALLVLAVVALVQLPVPGLLRGGSLPAWLPAGAATLALLLSALGFLFWKRLPVPAGVGRFFQALKHGVRPGRTLAAGLALAFGIHLFSFFLFFLFSRSLGLPITYPETLLFLPVLLGLMMLPVTVNGHGLRELILIFYFCELDLIPASSSAAGVAEFVVSLSILMVANELLWSLPGGIFYLAGFRGSR